MPAEFISKCTKKEEITDAVNMAYDDYLFRRQMEKKMAALRKNECEQYMSIAKSYGGCCGGLFGENII